MFVPEPEAAVPVRMFGPQKKKLTCTQLIPAHNRCVDEMTGELKMHGVTFDFDCDPVCRAAAHLGHRK